MCLPGPQAQAGRTPTSPPLAAFRPQDGSRGNSGQQRSPPQQGSGGGGGLPRGGEAVLSTRSETSRDLEALRIRRAVWRRAGPPDASLPAASGRGFLPGGAESYRAPPPQWTPGGRPRGENPCAAPNPRDRSQPQPSHILVSLGRTPNSASGAKVQVEYTGSTSLRKGNTLALRAVGSPPRPLPKPPPRPTFLRFL